MSPARRRACVEHVVTKHGVSERFACRVLGQHRSTQRKKPGRPDDEAALTDQFIADDVFARLLTFPNMILTGHQAFFTAKALLRIAKTNHHIRRNRPHAS